MTGRTSHRSPNAHEMYEMDQARGGDEQIIAKRIGDGGMARPGSGCFTRHFLDNLDAIAVFLRDADAHTAFDFPRHWPPG